MINLLRKSIFLMDFCNFNIYSQEILTIPEQDFKVPNNRDFNLNHSILPCINFFDYVCSNEIEKFRLPENKNKYTFSFDDSREKIKQKRIHYINSLLNKKNLDKRNVMIKNFYNSCMNEVARLLDEKNLLMIFLEKQLH